jgi:hypothetical protein
MFGRRKLDGGDGDRNHGHFSRRPLRRTGRSPAQ